MGTFESLIGSIAEDKPKSLLMGNGFSIAYDNLFNYSRLFDGADFLKTAADVSRIFTELDTVDFEEVIGLLDRVTFVNALYDHDLEDLLEEIKADQRNIRQALIDVLGVKHPTNNTGIKSRGEMTLSFLRNFDSLFTLNYDLLLYWVRLFEPRFKDGFGLEDRPHLGGRAWSLDGNQNVYHLHGSLCFFEHGNETIKLYGTGKTLEKAMDPDRLPLLVLEGTSEKKRQRIESNRYLRACHQRLREGRGCLFTYGFAFNENDQHIVENLCSFEHLCIGVFKRSEKSAVRSMLEEARKSLKIEVGDMPNIDFYDSSKVNLWVPQPSHLETPASDAMLVDQL